MAGLFALGGGRGNLLLKKYVVTLLVKNSRSILLSGQSLVCLAEPFTGLIRSTMSTRIKIPLRNLNPDMVRDLREKYPNAEISVETHPDQDKSQLSETNFWEIIALLDWSKEEEDDEAVVEPAKAFLASGPVRHIFEFADLLSQKLFALDGKVYAEQIGEYGWSPDRYFSVDNFLYARCCVVANGKELYEQVLREPSTMPKDLTFEELLYIPSEAYERKTGKPYDYSPAFPIETFSNKKGWDILQSSF